MAGDRKQRRRRVNVRIWRMREAHRRIARSLNQQKCGLIRVQDDVEIWAHGETGRTYYRGLVTCGSWSACPVCARRIAARKGDEIAEALKRHMATGGDVWLVTLTLSHSFGDRLKPLRDALSESWSKLQTGAAWAGGKRIVGWRNRLGLVGAIRAIDCTHSEVNGWHPHLHILFLLDRPIGWRDALAFRRWLTSRWQTEIVKRLGDAAKPSARRGVRIQRGHSAGWYVAKLGLARELAGLWTKRAKRKRRRLERGKPGHRTPWQVLDDFARAKRGSAEWERDRRIWCEWVDAMHGAQQVTWSKRLRDRLGLAEEEPDEVLASRPAALDRRLYEIPAFLWDRIASIALAPAAVLDAADEGGIAGIERQIRRLTPVLGHRPHHRLEALTEEQARIEQHMRFQAIGAEDRRRRIAEGVHRRIGIRHDGAWAPFGGPPAWMLGSTPAEVVAVQESIHANAGV